MIETVLNTAFFSVVHTNEVVQVIKNWSSWHSEHILKSSVPIISFNIADLINHSISEGTFPVRLKVTKVILL